MPSKTTSFVDINNPRQPAGEQLIALHESIQPQQLPIGTASYILGRHPSCQVIVRLNVVSRFHARIERFGTHCILSDTGSTNGTFVNGRRLSEPHILTTDDQIGLGSSTPALRFCDWIDTTDPAEGGRATGEEWLFYDQRTMQFYLRGYPVNLSMQQFRLLLYLYNNEGTVCTREECATIIGGPSYTLATYSGLDEALNKLRTKLCQTIPEADDQTYEAVRKKLIITRPGRGYVLYRRILLTHN